MRWPHAPTWVIAAIYVPLLIALVTLLYNVNQFIAIIVGIIGLIGLVVLVIPKLRPDKTILYRLISNTIVLNIEESEEVKGDVQVLFKGEEVKGNIHLVFLKVWNASSKPIMLDDYKSKAIRLNFGKEAKIFSVEVSESKPPSFKGDIDNNSLISFDPENVFIIPTWLDVDNSFTLKVLISNFQGNVSTDESRIILGGYVRDWNNTIYRKIKDFIDSNLAAALIMFIMAFILFCMLIWLLSIFYPAPNKPDYAYTIIVLVICVAPVLLATYITKKFISNRLEHLFD